MISIDELYEIIDAASVADYIGIEVVKRGANLCIRCPGHEKRLGKPDNNIGNAVLTQRGYRCFACDTFVNMVNMVREHQDCNYWDAVNIIAKAAGYDTVASSKADINRHPLSYLQCNTLGLKHQFLQRLYKDSQKDYKDLVLKNAEEMLRTYKRILDAYCARDSSKAHLTYELLEVNGSLATKDILSLTYKVKNAIRDLEEIIEVVA